MPEPALTPERVQPGPIGSVLLGGAFLVVSLAIFLPGGAVGHDLRQALGREFGWGIYLVPLVLGAFAALALRSRFEEAFQARSAPVVGWVLEFLALVTLFEAMGRWLTGTEASGGGRLGRLAWSALDGAFGPRSALVLTLAVALVAFLLVLEVSGKAVWTGAKWLLATLPRVGWRLLGGLAHWLRQVVAPRPKPRRLEVVPLDGDQPREGSEPVRATSLDPANWQLPSLALLKTGSTGELSQADLAKKITLIEDTLADFDVYAKVVQVNPGPTVTQFGLEPGFRERRDRNGVVVRREKIKVSEITALQNDLALALAAPSIRIEAPVPGRQVVGLEIPNGQTTVVSLRQVVESSAFQKLRLKTRLALALGEDVSGQPVAADLGKMPHLLIAGATGSGKSVCINAIISCLLLQATPADVRLLLVDPKRVELSVYNDVPHLLRPVVVDVDQVVGVLRWVVHEMDERYKRFEKEGVRNIEGFNKLIADRGGTAAPFPGAADVAAAEAPLPYLVVVIDELADLMMLAPDETERLLCRLAQLARATGIHLVVATQRPSVDVITGLIKANFPTRISFAVTSQVDSRTILDTPGAEKLLGRGDMLYLPTDAAKPIRLQGVWVSEEEIEALTNHWRALGSPSYVDTLVNLEAAGPVDDGDELYDKAVEVSREHTRISASLLQRRLHIGYARAARLLDQLEENGVVGPAEGGGRSREVLPEATP